MAVVSEESIRQRIWRGYDDPGLPMGAWFGWVQSTGDLSGGSNVAALVIEPEGQPLTGNFYNLEALEVTTSEDLSVIGQAALTIINLSGEMAGAFFNREWTVELRGNTRLNAAMPIAALLARPLFLGQSDQAQVPTQMQLTTANVDGEVVVMRAEGFIWGARATQAPGGLRRPIEALYG